MEAYYDKQHQQVEGGTDGALTVGNLNDISKLTADGLVAHALSSGDANSVKELLREKNLDKVLEKTFHQLQIAQRHVRGSEAEKDNLIPKFLTMRVHSGCSSLLFYFEPT